MSQDVVLKNNTAVNGTDETITVTIYGSKMDESWEKNPIDLPIPTSPSNYSNGWSRLLIDLNKIKRVFTLTGYIVGSSTESDEQVKENIITMFENTDSTATDRTGFLTLIYKGKKYRVMPIKVKFTEDASRQNPFAITSAQASAGSSVAISVDDGTIVASGDDISIHGMNGITEQSEKCDVTGTTATTITVDTLVSTYDAGAFIRKVQDKKVGYGVILTMWEGTPETSND